MQIKINGRPGRVQDGSRDGKWEPKDPEVEALRTQVREDRIARLYEADRRGESPLAKFARVWR